MEKLTIKQAIEQGYTKYGFANKDWQHTEDLHDDVFEEVDEEHWCDLVLFEKQTGCPSITPETIAQILSEHIGEDDEQTCARDDDEVYKAVEELDYTQTAEMINKALSKHKYWVLTDIHLIKESA